MTLAQDLRDQFSIGDFVAISQTISDAVDTGVALGIAKLTRTPAVTGAVRALNTPFQIDAANPALVIYSVALDVTAGLLSAASETVRLLVDTVNPPVAIVDTVSLYINQLLGLVNVGIRNQAQGNLVAWVPAGSWVELAASGSGTATLASATEVVFA